MIGKKIAALRKQANLSQADIAERSGIMQSALSNIESGKRQPTTATIESIAKALNIKTSFLFDDLQPAPTSSLNIGYKITELRNAKKMTKHQLAELAEMNPSSIEHIEDGSATPSLDMLVKIAKALEVRPSVLIDEGFLPTPDINITTEERHLLNAIKTSGINARMLSAIVLLQPHMIQAWIQAIEKIQIAQLSASSLGLEKVDQQDASLKK